ncbi:MAG: hypothetical protein DRR16_23645 [Candidatus Parabeggiatoa sp. nov. 3]|nr:MAG: hypothetical protein DRR00_20740 [Gammaproteobacteria bacterium]RKZ63094.1 MAG: hypothetical protein DRQ99_17665 [Gammaproteobacteria bacterium]RKZ80563.1 MAG: hypothetical protein DRR16_23645 [Gammaproteobacteria bacterium]
MYPNIHYDETNDLAYIQFSDQKIVNSESEDELLVFDVGSQGELSVLKSCQSLDSYINPICHH